MNRLSKIGLAALAGAVGGFATAPAQATLIADGVTYALTDTPLTATSAQFTLDITDHSPTKNKCFNKPLMFGGDTSQRWRRKSSAGATP